MLVQLSALEEALVKGVEGGLGSIARSSSQFDCKDRVSPSHGEEGPQARVIEYEVNVLGLALVVVGVTDRSCDTKLSVRPILHEWRSRMGVSWQVIDQLLISSVYYDRRGG